MLLPSLAGVLARVLFRAWAQVRSRFIELQHHFTKIDRRKSFLFRAWPSLRFNQGRQIAVTLHIPIGGAILSLSLVEQSTLVFSSIHALVRRVAAAAAAPPDFWSGAWQQPLPTSLFNSTSCTTPFLLDPRAAKLHTFVSNQLALVQSITTATHPHLMSSS